MKFGLSFENRDLETIINMYNILDTVICNVLDNQDITEPFTGVTYQFGDISLDGETVEKFYNFLDELHNHLFIGDYFGYKIEKEEDN